MTPRQALLAFCISLCSIQAFGDSQWITAGTIGVAPDYDTLVEVDASSVRAREGFKVAWVRYTYQKENVFQGMKYKSSLNLVAFDCKNREFTSTAYSLYEGPFGIGKALVSGSSPKNSWAGNMAPVIPDTIGESMLMLACAK